MKRKISLALLLAACVLMLTGCFCDHEWEDAKCELPATCALCGKTEGEPLGHTWVEADCVTPKTCSACQLAEGEALGHTWTEATCTEAKTCTVCAATEGEALGHTWLDATTEAPKTCEVCAATEGERIITDERFTTADCKDLFGTWNTTVTVDKSFIGDDLFEGQFDAVVTVTYAPDGTGSFYMEVVDLEEYRTAMFDYVKSSTYAQMELMGYSKAMTDATVQQEFGMTMDAYIQAAVDMLDGSELAEEMTFIYYVEDGRLHMGDSWDGVNTYGDYTVEKDTLTVENDWLAPDITLTMTRVTE